MVTKAKIGRPSKPSVLAALADRVRHRPSQARLRGQCRHCGKVCSLRPRRLCWTCYESLTIRDSYPSGSKFCSKGGDVVGGHSLPALPTQEEPGTEGKVRVMVGRYEARVALWHPQDRLMDEEGGAWHLR